ncbi:MAG: 50S ribosomal protein L15 [Candidatus Omnitrophica bacterium]|nr:50S ribosomal protein L15 [Candidatus Omnitrophota bacterium]
MEKKELKNKKIIRPVKAAAKKPAKKVLLEETVALYKLSVPRGAHKKKKLLGRGPGSGHGKTSTRGSKGQTSRAGRHFYLGFEGGQSPLIRRMPKRGFTSKFRTSYQIVNLRDLSRVKETTITLDVLKTSGLIKDKSKLVKILGDGQLKNPINITAHAFSKKAMENIQSAGGKAEIINV